MAVTSSPNPDAPRVHRLPQDTYIDALRWLPHLSTTFTRHLLLATYHSDTSTPSLQTLTLTLTPTPTTPLSLSPQSSLSLSSRITSLKTCPTKPLIAASTFSGSLFFCTVDSVTASLNWEFDIGPEKGFHTGEVSAIDLSEGGEDCVSVGEDGRVNLVNLGGRGFRRVYDGDGLVSYNAVKWASPVEFVTGGLGYGLQWWDLRKGGGGPAALFKANWTGYGSSGIVHSIDIHPSRKHACLAGGSAGALFAWDIRRPQQPVILSGVGIGDAPSNSLVESDIWEVKYDNYTNTSRMSNLSSSKILPAMICSEDGILGVIEQGEEPIELLAEPCAINSFDIDKQNPSDVVCSLEWESIAILTRA